ncbi:MAG TPA: nucleotidyltransferase [Candidatus Acetothermia bacterium]|nr:nucleotidyltransferase [Candidatus Acetothermia bacterium]
MASTNSESEKIIALLTDRRGALARFGVSSLAVFGSVVRGEYRPESDVGVLVELVEFDPEAHVGLFKMVELKEFLERLLGCSVDIVTPDGLRAWMRDRVQKEAIRVV